MSAFALDRDNVPRLSPFPTCMVNCAYIKTANNLKVLYTSTDNWTATLKQEYSRKMVYINGNPPQQTFPVLFLQDKATHEEIKISY